MARLSSFLAGLAIAITISAAPLTVPLGTSGQSLTISDDGQSISISGQTMSLTQVMASSKSCIGRKKDADRKGAAFGAVKGAGRGVAATTKNAKAIYFITNVVNNSVVALKVAADGTLSDGSITATGGAGMSGVDSTGAPAAPDALFSQGAVKVAGSSLVAVNPGSNTLSMFAIDSTDPTKLTMVGQPVDTLGEFPMSVALSTTLNQACVANSGAKAGIACFSMSATKGLTALDTSLRTFNISQKTPPVGPTNTVSQTFFNADSTALMTTVKGDPTVNNTGFLSIFPVVNNQVATQDVRSSPAGTAVLFGTALIPKSNNVFITDASFGSATLTLSSDNIATIAASTKINDQSATCWATISDATGSAFVTDVAVNHLVEVDTTSGRLIKELNVTNGNPGMVDLVSAGNFIYALSPGNATAKAAITVFDVSGGQGTAKEIQNFSPAGVADSAQGMTFV
ncbi:Uncharacterized protein BP5553_02679 [Venustampulla echinocandica]|uniref:3-carboxymuconate cyclase n=1 Tax=Venustampulla echinocandica TaxID=2656787 RepID=A0A370TS27_9HELO|nr:Uncharacterized protein BP5553_02679 [Venustampulla echinocandica]RDL38339.1 Uncharacterized protein BP5553_02679 [Venustampulla echinocandica]